VTDWSDLPGAELVDSGLRDARLGTTSPGALLIAIGAPRLRRLGLSIPADQDLPADAERKLYRLLGSSGVSDPFSRYNALIRELVSFERALEQRRAAEQRRGRSL
jgi:hypothetical protein